MTPKIYTTVILLCFTLLNNTFAQTQNRQEPADWRIPGQIIVQLEPKVSCETVLASLQAQLPEAGFFLKNTLSPAWHIYLLGFQEDKFPGETALAFLRNTDGIQEVQFDALVEDRNTEPNDTFWDKQGNMQLIQAPHAWDVTTGGLTASGDTIVVGILEKGANRQHPDLKPNLWVNWKEIPGNLIDDDQNGYVDDYLGYNAVVGGDGAGEISGHPSGVSGIIGARGNNGIGVSGVNWNVKLLNVVVAGLESDIVKGYNYLGDLRRQYNESNGQRGAFIVATNASFGIDWDLGGQPENFPLWCAVYDSLGVLGILSCAATTNKDVNVDKVGDMPTGCSSEYMIAVTEVNQIDQREPAGVGRKNVDLAAPGAGTWSTSLADSYAFIGGCSAATPHVSGAVALLYSVDCKQFTKDALSDPAACARRVKEVILESVKPLSDLRYFTVTGGRLDVGRAVDLVTETCNGADLGPLSVMTLFPNPAQDWLWIDYQTPEYSKQPLRIYNVLGQLMEDTTVESKPFEYSRLNVDVSYWHSGTYYVVFGADKGVETKVFVKL